MCDINIFSPTFLQRTYNIMITTIARCNTIDWAPIMEEDGTNRVKWDGNGLAIDGRALRE